MVRISRERTSASIGGLARIRLITSALNERNVIQTELGTMTSKAKAKRILLVDDDPAVRSALAQVLAEEGYTVLCGANGDEALRAAENAIDLVLLDLNMPIRNGWDTFERLTAQTQRLELENNRLLEQYARWAYNAHTRGLDDQFLNRRLPAVDRGQTKVKP